MNSQQEPEPGRRPDAVGLTTWARPNRPVFEVHATDGAARAGVLRTAHGEVRTPVFMPVGTKGTVKTLHPDEVRSLGAQIVLGTPTTCTSDPATTSCATSEACTASCRGTGRS